MPRGTSKVAIPAIDLHAHYAMHLKLVQRVCDSDADKLGNQALFAAANTLFNHGAKGVRVSLAEKARVSFASALYHPADEVWGPCDPLRNIIAQMDQVERDLKKSGCDLVTTPKALGSAVKDGRSCAFHSIEGGYAVEAPGNIRALADRGVAYITVAHLIYRGVSACVNGLPFMTDDSFSKVFCMPVPGLSALGEDICEAMMDNGIIVDITHMTEHAISRVLDMALAKGRPVIASHTCSRKTSSDSYLLNVSDETIQGIHRTGGVVGVIFFDHWLRRPEGEDQEGLDLVIRAMDHIKQVAGIEAVAIGSDLDGFINPVDGLTDISKVAALAPALREHGYSDAEVEAVMWRNAHRALSLGWGVKG